MYCKQVYSDNIRKVFDMGVVFSEQEISFFRKQLIQRTQGLKKIEVQNKQIEVIKDTQSKWNPIIGSHILEVAMNCKGLSNVA